MQLSNEDSLRLNVLMAQKPKAIRIDEGKMLLYSLTAKGEAKIALNPTLKNDRYLALVKDFLSNKVLDVAGGFPAYISRWNRMGEARGEQLDKLLLLGEPEAVAAVVNSKELTAELASSAWWASQSADNARSMLANDALLNTDIGVELAKFLLEFLPFEEDPSDMLQSVRLVLRPGLISEQEKLSLWKKAKTKNTLYLGFLDTIPNEIPDPLLAHKDNGALVANLAELRAKGNIYAQKLCQLSSAQGQTFLHTAQLAFKRPPNQAVYVALVESIRHYVFCQHCEVKQSEQNQNFDFSKAQIPNELRIGQASDVVDERDIESIKHYAHLLCEDDTSLERSTALSEILEQMPELRDLIKAIILLSRISHIATIKVFSQSTAVGSVMRKKLKPVSDEVITQLNLLQHFSLD